MALPDPTTAARPEPAGLAPAMALAGVGLAALIGAALMRDGPPGQFLVLLPPVTDAGRAMVAVHAAGGGVIRHARLPGLVVAISDRDDFRDRMRQQGAWMILPAPGDFGCVTARPGGL